MAATHLRLDHPRVRFPPPVRVFPRPSGVSPFHRGREGPSLGPEEEAGDASVVSGAVGFTGDGPVLLGGRKGGPPPLEASLVDGTCDRPEWSPQARPLVSTRCGPDWARESASLVNCGVSVGTSILRSFQGWFEAGHVCVRVGVEAWSSVSRTWEVDREWGRGVSSRLLWATGTALVAGGARGLTVRRGTGVRD